MIDTAYSSIRHQEQAAKDHQRIVKMIEDMDSRFFAKSYNVERIIIAQQERADANADAMYWLFQTK